MFAQHQNAAMVPFYLKALDLLAKEIDEGMVPSTEVARGRIAELLQADKV